ncbi:MAG: TonB-dependent receptor [Acidobacteria bacterium]|nr:MAG: TonB-dependent receptor [Acidobacteriota bacterium]
MKLRYLRILALVILALGLSSALVQPASADELYGRIRGIALDPTGAALPGVQLKLTNVGTGTTEESVSGSDGSFAFSNLKPGEYKLAATKASFKTFQVSSIRVAPNEIYVQNVSMELGTINETIEVAANQAQVEQTSIQLTASVTSKTITDLPLNGRNWIALQQTLPGVVIPDTRFNSNYSTNGSQGQQNSYLINGNDYNDLPLNSPLAPPNPDTIEEVKMVTNTINPEFGRNSGAIMNAVTRSGTNSFHGTAFDFYRDTFLNVHDFFHAKPQPFHQNQYGGTIGGPVWKNKTFFFFGLQNTRARQPGTNSNGTTNVFTQDMLNGTWNPAKMSTTKQNPFPIVGSSGATYPAGTPWATIFPTGIVPTTDYNSLAASLVKKFVPLPNCGTATCTLYSFQPLTQRKANQFIGRMDQNFGSKDSLWFYAYANDEHTLNDIAFSAASLPGFGDKSAPYTKQFTASWQHTISTNVVNELRAGYTRFNFDTGTPQMAVTPASVGFTNIFPQIPQGAGYPRMTLTGYFNLGFTSNGPQPRKDQTYQLNDNYSWVKGRHSLKFGYDGRKFQVWNPFGARNNGAFSFSNSAKYSTGDPGLNFLLGIPTSYNQGSGQIILAQAYEHYFFAQDQWRVKNNLTLTFGAGYQIDTPIAEYQSAGLSRACFIPDLQSKVFPLGVAPNGNPAGSPVGYAFPGDPGCDTKGGVSTKFNHIGPRVGFAYTPNWGRLTGGAGKTSVRAGFGLYFNRGEEELNLQDLGSPPIGQTSNGVGDLGLVPSFPDPWADVAGGGTLKNKFPYVAPTPGSLIDFGQYFPMGINTVDHNLTTPYAMNYNLTIEREIPSKTILRISYVGAKGRNLITSYSFNPMTPAGLQTCLVTPACASNGDGAPVNFPNLFLYPGDIWGNSGQQHSNGWSNYNALQITADKRMSHGLQFLTTYTWSHSLDTGSSFEDTAFLTGGGFDPFGRLRRDYGNSAFDARHRFTLSLSYEFPKPSLVPRLLGGWRVTGQTILQTGLPINFQDSNELSLVCSTSFSFYSCPDRPDLVKAPVALNPRSSTTHLWFDPASFTDNALGTLGNVTRGFFHGPGYWGTNFSIQKDTKITEGKTFQVRLEAFNVFNHANFANPDADVASPTFGQIRSLRAFAASGPSPEGSRLIQLAAKFIF